MALGHKLSGLKRTKFENKKDRQKAEILKGHFNTLGYKIPAYLQKDKILDRDFERALSRVTKGYENKIRQEKDYTLKKVRIDKKGLNLKLKTSINSLNRTIDKTINLLKDLGYNDKQIEYLKGNPIYGATRKKPFFKDNMTLDKEDIDSLYNKTAKDIQNTIKRIKEKTKQLKPKNYIKFITNSTDSDIFFKGLMEEEFVQDLAEKEINDIEKNWNRQEPLNKEILIKSYLDKLREEYKNKYERDWSENTELNTYHRLMEYMNGASEFFNKPF